MSDQKNLLFVILFIIILKINGYSNVIASYYGVSEFLIDSNGWKIEMYSYHNDTVHIDSSYFMTTVEDTVFFKKQTIIFSDSSGDEYDPALCVLTNNNLREELLINRKQDKIQVHGPDNYFEENHNRISYGNSQFPPPPENGQSICYYLHDPCSPFLDNSPTIGRINDSRNAKGEVLFNIVDSNSEPLKNIYIYCPWESVTYVRRIGVSDNEGEIKLDFISGKHELYFSPVDSLKDVMYFFQEPNHIKEYIIVYPETTNTVNVQIPDSILTQIDRPQPAIPITDKYRLSNNYPNPFNRSTTFTYQIPIDDYIEIKLFNLQGRLVKTLESGFKTAGRYKVGLAAPNLSSGIFFYRLETANETITRKCMFLK